MPTRFRLRATSRTPPITPAFDAAWDVTGEADRIWVDREPKNSVSTNAVRAETSVVPVNVLTRQYVIGPLGAHTYLTSDTFKGQIRALESAAANDMNAQCVIRVASSSGSIEGTLIAADNSLLSAEFPVPATGATNRRFPKAGAVAVANQVAASEGHYLLVEVGARASNVSSTSRTSTLNFIDQYAVADLPEDETTQTALRPWVEYSGTIPHIATLSVYETELRAKSVVSYWPLDNTTNGIFRDTQQRWPLTVVGAPTIVAGPTSIVDDAASFDGTDDAADILPNPIQTAGTLIVWAQTPSLTETDHDEAAFNTADTARIQSGAFVEIDDGGTIKWEFHYVDNLDVARDLIGNAVVANRWEFLAVTCSSTGLRFYQVVAGTVTLLASDLVPNITAFTWNAHRLAQGRTEVLFGEWSLASAARFDTALTVTDLQAIYDAASSGTNFTISPTGTITGAGAVSRLISKTLAGSSTGTGTIARFASKLVVGSITAAGTLVRLASKLFTGSATATGALSKETSKSFAGSMSPSGTLSKLSSKLFTGSITGSGALSTIKVIALQLAGVITATGAITKAVAKNVAGFITGTGSLGNAIAKQLTGVVIAAGTIAKATAKNLTGTITPSGTLALVTALLRFLRWYAGAAFARTATDIRVRWASGRPRQ